MPGRGAAEPGPALSPPLARFVLRGRPPVTEAAAAALGLDFDPPACRAVREGEWSCLWLGPTERLILAPPGDGPRVEAALRGAVAGRGGAVVDIGHRQIGLAVRGPTAANRLNSGCPLDLDPTAFPIDMCARTIFAKCEIVLWRTAVDGFHVEVWRSFAPYLLGHLEIAAVDADDG